MNDKPIPKAERERLAKAYAVVNELRRSLDVSEPQQELTRINFDEDCLIAKADGFGSGWIIWYEDYGECETLVHDRELLDNEKDAHDAVEWFRKMQEEVNMSRTEFFFNVRTGTRPWSLDPTVLSPPV